MAGSFAGFGAAGGGTQGKNFVLSDKLEGGVQKGEGNLVPTSKRAISKEQQEEAKVCRTVAVGQMQHIAGMFIIYYRILSNI